MFKKIPIPPAHRKIHEKIKARHFFFKFHYPKTALLILCIILAYLLFRLPAVSDFVLNLNGFGYLGVFLAGMLFSFGFTTPFAIGFFVTLDPTNALVYALLGGLGAFISDMTIFKFIKFSFEDEFREMERTKFAKYFEKAVRARLSHRIRVYLLYGIIGLVIASPLPDEIGVILLAGLTKVNPKIFGIISYVFNTLGILAMLLI